MGTFSKCSKNPYLDSYLRLPDRCIYETHVKSNYSIYEIIQILSVSAFDKTHVRDLLTTSQVNQNVKELQYNLFDNMFYF